MVEDDTTSTSTSTSTTDATTTDDGTTSDDDAGASSSSEGSACPPDAECDAEGRGCKPGQDCVGCFCFGEPTGCNWDGVGVYAECGDVGVAACQGDADFCLTSDGGTSVCSFDCTETCDCPAPPNGFEDRVRCESITTDDDSECFLSCEDTGECPAGMFCAYEFICVHGDSLPAYGDCLHEPLLCDDAVCFIAAPGSVEGYCAPECEVDADCPDAPGTATVDCSGDRCRLLCDDDGECPAGMSCEDGICSWTTPWADCSNIVPNHACEDEPIACHEGVCSRICFGGVGDCPEAPPTGDATIMCGYPDPELDFAPLCYLSCADGETCPDGMICNDYPGPTAACNFPG
jgi:hypothetical protein